MEQSPEGEGRVWLNNKGRVIWSVPDEDETVTFQERNFPEAQNGIEKVVIGMESTEDRQWRRFYHSLEVSQDAEE